MNINIIKYYINSHNLIKNKKVHSQYLKISFDKNKLLTQMTEYLHNEGMSKSISVIDACHIMSDSMNDDLDIILEGPKEDLMKYFGKSYNCGCEYH